VLQDFGIMKLDDILHVMATALGTEVVSLKDREIPPEVLKLIPAKVAQMYQCLPVGIANGHVAGGAGRSAGSGRRMKSISSPSATCRLSWPTRRKSSAALNAFTARRRTKASPKSSRNWATTKHRAGSGGRR
jgi:hypothetical protein